LWFETWVARGANPLLFVRAARVGTRFRQLQCLRVARLPDVVTPVISVVPNDAASTDRTVAWLRGGAFHAVDVGLERITRPVRSAAVSGAGAFIVEPLWKDPDTDGATGLVWDEVDPQRSTLSLVDARSEGVSVVATAQVQLPRPQWIRGFHDSTGGRLALFVADDGVRTSLHGVLCRPGIELSKAPFDMWPWRLRAASAQLTRDDTIVGAVAGQAIGASSSATTIVSCWSLDPAGRFSAEAPRPWAALDAEEFDHLQMVVDVAGRPAALVHSAESGWSCVREDVSYAVTLPLGLVTNLPPTLELAPDGMTPMVVWHDAWRGLIPTPVGVEVPDFLGEDFIQPQLASEGS
jgi:hypothetical protein